MSGISRKLSVTPQEEFPMKTTHKISINHDKISALAEILADKLIEEIRKKALEKSQTSPKEAA